MVRVGRVAIRFQWGAVSFMFRWEFGVWGNGRNVSCELYLWGNYQLVRYIFWYTVGKKGVAHSGMRRCVSLEFHHIFQNNSLLNIPFASQHKWRNKRDTHRECTILLSSPGISFEISSAGKLYSSSSAISFPPGREWMVAKVFSLNGFYFIINN